MRKEGHCFVVNCTSHDFEVDVRQKMWKYAVNKTSFLKIKG